MKATKISELDAVFEAAVKIITEPYSRDMFTNAALSKIFAPSFLVYGASGEEIFMNFDDFRELKKDLDKNKQGQQFNPGVESIPVFRSYSPDGSTALYVDEVQTRAGATKGSTTAGRLSTVFNKTDMGWRVTHLHYSTPSKIPVKEKSSSLNNFEKRIAEMQQIIEEQSIALNEAGKKQQAIREQLIKQEKLASLGQLTAGIAHEIKNPLNFINNFSELSAEFIEEIEENVQKLSPSEVTEEILGLLEDIKGNLNKIHHHGTRADGIVKSMLLHSRGGSGKMEDVNLNELIKEYINLAFHGMRANKNAINVDIKLETDKSLGPVKINPENFSRVILNLCKNAFDAMREKQQQTENKTYLPQLVVRTGVKENRIIVEIEDNGPGVPEEIREKLMQPFFTTKKGTEGTGLGLSISKDIIESHGGELEIDSEEGEFTRFTIKLKKT
ncbi:MAG: ATP-binding protein [Gillisia sp.]